MVNDTLVSEKGAHRNMLTCQSEIYIYLSLHFILKRKVDPEKSGSWESLTQARIQPG